MHLSRGRITLVAVALAGASLMSSLYAFSDTQSGAAFPTDYRNWSVSKTKLVGPNSKNFASGGGIHSFYANDPARRGFAARPFADGSVLVDERVHAAENADGIWVEGATISVAVMIKDSKRYAATGGWGYNLFQGSDRTLGLPPEGQKACFDCHTKAAQRDFVFSDFRTP